MTFAARTALALATLTLAAACGPMEDDALSGGDGEAVEGAEPGEDESALTTNVGLAAVADTEITQSTPNKTAGAQTTVRARQSGKFRSLFRFDTAAIQGAVQNKTLLRARLRVKHNVAASSMTAAGRNVDVHSMTKAWTEAGASWNCANDTSPGNNNLNCASGDLWTMGAAPLPYASTASVSALVANGATGYVYFDVTADVSAILATPSLNKGWLVKLQNEALSGSVTFNSRSLADGPRLIIDVAGPCGDGVTDTLNGEQCDDGNNNDNDGCDATCGWEGCGDGVVMGGEQCDDGNRQGGDGCGPFCQLEYCGDFMRNGGNEECDGNASDSGCSATCTVLHCGDGILSPSEQCDDGDRQGGDGCGPFCQLEYCGDFMRNGGSEECDGNASDSGCSATCTVLHCGDGILSPSEQCDDGDRQGGDGCGPFCQLEYCGDFMRNGGTEECDGNASDSGCSATCTVLHCGDGILSPSEQCDDGDRQGGDGCGPFCQLEYCGDFMRNGGNEECDGNASDSGCSATCTVLHCGDGILSPSEQCDDGDRQGGDGCGPFCQLESCGDGMVNGGNEGCDDGNTTSGDGCSATCEVEGCGGPCSPVGCGNGVTEAGEQCDDGNFASRDGCNFCVLERCGDFTTNNRGSETCDDGNVVSNDGCSATCAWEFCGDGMTQPNEQCDDANQTTGDGCNFCVLERCGDFTTNNRGSETCDDGNVVSNDGCSSACAWEFCGDGVTQPNEQCDDANQTTGDGCNFCVLERCGDFTTNNRGSETCDDGNLVANDGCSSACAWEFCGDGVTQPNEQCDDANQTTGDGCNFCVLERCGDFTTNNHGTETCDDGNVVSDDGCSSACAWEFCGDGVQQPNEQCDDANQTTGDGCNFCVLERCGDFTTNNRGTETCDDGNLVSGDGCSSACAWEFCGDAVLQTNEACDDGNMNAGDGCSPSCTVEPGPEICGDGLDNDGDGQTDCADSSCATAFTCQ